MSPYLGKSYQFAPAWTKEPPGVGVSSRGRCEDGWKVHEEKEHLWKLVSIFLFSVSSTRIHFAVVHQQAGGHVCSKGVLWFSQNDILRCGLMGNEQYEICRGKFINLQTLHLQEIQSEVRRMVMFRLWFRKASKKTLNNSLCNSEMAFQCF